ncbi:MAG: MogA/MoaB family molybdenum cofactor biosynthesis protein [Promethearchaeota archaeon]
MDDALPNTVEEHKKNMPKKINFHSLIISTTRFGEITNEKKSTDKTVQVIKDIIESAGYDLVGNEFCPDVPALIEEKMRRMLVAENVDVVISSGGTGISPKDQTIEVMMHLNMKILPGFGELFRALSYKEIGTAAIMSRAEAFIHDKKCVFCLPGSPKAVKLALEKIVIPEVGHILSQIRKKE